MPSRRARLTTHTMSVGATPNDPYAGLTASDAAPAGVPVFFVSGAAALIYQVVWQRALFAIYGVDTSRLGRCTC